MKSIRCLLGFHDHTWIVTMTDPQLNWQECERCGHVEGNFANHAEMYANYKSEQ